MNESYSEKVRRVQRYLCENCKHEKCVTSDCPYESLTDDDILSIYNRAIETKN